MLAASNGRTSQHIGALFDAADTVRPVMDLALLSGVWTSQEGVKGGYAAIGFIDMETHLMESNNQYQSH